MMDAAMFSLTPEESRILRRELAAVRGLIAKGMITADGDLTADGSRWIADYNEQVKQARAAGGGQRKIGPRKRTQIARKAAKARHAKK